MSEANSTATIEQKPTRQDGLRALADLIDAHPDLEVFGDTRVYVFARDAADMARLARQLGGYWEKGKTGESYYDLNRDLGGGVRFQITAQRENVCERVVTGTRTVTVPDPDAEDTRPTVEVEEEIVEWVCPPSLAKQEASTHGVAADVAADEAPDIAVNASGAFQGGNLAGRPAL